MQSLYSRVSVYEPPFAFASNWVEWFLSGLSSGRFIWSCDPSGRRGRCQPPQVGLDSGAIHSVSVVVFSCFSLAFLSFFLNHLCSF